MQDDSKVATQNASYSYERYHAQTLTDTLLVAPEDFLLSSSTGSPQNDKELGGSAGEQQMLHPSFYSRYNCARWTYAPLQVQMTNNMVLDCRDVHLLILDVMKKAALLRYVPLSAVYLQ